MAKTGKPQTFSNEAMSIIDWLSDTSGDHLPSDELIQEATSSFEDSLLLSSGKNATRKALSEIFEIIDGKVRLREEALLAIRAKLVEKTGEQMPAESKEAVELALESNQPFSPISMSKASLRDGGGSFKNHSNGIIAPTAETMKHMLARILLDGSRGGEVHADNTGNNH